MSGAKKPSASVFSARMRPPAKLSVLAEPFEKGYALTVGNSLRRTLLSIIPGAAVTWARVKGDDVRARRHATAAAEEW